MKSLVTKVLSVALLISAVPGFAMQAPAAPTKTLTQKVKDAASTVSTKAKNAATTVKNNAVKAKNATVELVKPVQKLATDALKEVRLVELKNKQATLKAAATKTDAKLTDKLAYAKNFPVNFWETLKVKNPTGANVAKYSTIAAGTAAAAGLVALTVYGVKKAYNAYNAKSENKDANKETSKTEKQAEKGLFANIIVQAQALMKNQKDEIIRSERLYHTAYKPEALKQLEPAVANALMGAVIDFDNAFRTEKTKREQAVKQAYESLVQVTNAQSMKSKMQNFFGKVKNSVSKAA